MNYPTLNEIRAALFKLAQESLAQELESGLAYLAAPNQDNNPDQKCVLIFTSFSPGSVSRQKLGGAGSLALRRGIFKIAISSLPDDDADIAWEIAQKLERSFAPFTFEDLPIDGFYGGSGCHCDCPYSESVGLGPDNRNIITVTAPWLAWVQT